MGLVVLLHLLLSLLCLVVFFDVVLGCGWFSFGFGVVWVLDVGAFGMVVGGVYGSRLWVTPYWYLSCVVCRLLWVVFVMFCYVFCFCGSLLYFEFVGFAVFA